MTSSPAAPNNNNNNNNNQNNQSSMSAWPAAAALLVSWRIYWAARLPIMDCDEVYNYWEPLFFMLYRAGGQQTWEYAHQYALRTHAYLWPLTTRVTEGLMRTIVVSTAATPGLWTDFDVTTHRLATFVGFKVLLAAGMACAEIVWCHALTTTVLSDPVHPRRHVGWYTAVVLATSAGMNHAAAALLPSSTWTAAFLLASAAYLHQWHYTFCAIAVTATLAIGWPFGVVLLVPLGCRILYKELFGTQQQQQQQQQQGGGGGGVMAVIKLLGFTAFVTVAVQAAVMYIDYQAYGIWVSPTLNIFTYNAAGGGDELYGVEPVSYYVKNLLLNLNIVAPLGVVVLPLLVFTQLRNLDLVVLMLPLYLWLAITVPRPHKEERFLYPIYPLLVLGAVLTLDKVANFLGRIVAAVSRHKELTRRQRHVLHGSVWSVAVALSTARTFALYKYYSAPLHVYATLAKLPPSSSAAPSFVCTCGEWYRFPSSFFLPENMHLRFLESSFKGQLPQPFSEYGSRPESQQVLQPFNDQNREEPARYVDIAICDWIVDLEDGQCAPPTAEVVQSVPFLDASRTTSALHRILYLPFLPHAADKVQYQNYMLYKMPSSS